MLKTDWVMTSLKLKSFACKSKKKCNLIQAQFLLVPMVSYLNLKT